MKVTSVLNQQSVVVAKSQDVPTLKPSWLSFRMFFFGRNKKPDDIIDAQIVGFAKWKGIAASYIQRIGRCIAATDPGVWFVIVIGGVVGSIFGMGMFMDMDIHNQSPSFLVVISHLIGMIIKCILVGWFLLYFGWEFVQGWRWLTSWSERVKKEEQQYGEK